MAVAQFLLVNDSVNLCPQGKCTPSENDLILHSEGDVYTQPIYGVNEFFLNQCSTDLLNSADVGDVVPVTFIPYEFKQESFPIVRSS